MPDKDLNIIQTVDSIKMNSCASLMAVSDPWVTLGLDIDHCRRSFEGEGKEIYVLEYKGEVAGFVIIQVLGSFKGYIQTLCISEKYRGRGWGHGLLQFCQERIRKISPNIFICVSSFNTKAIRLYLEFGFEQVGELRDFVRSGFTELLLRKTFGPLVG